MASERVGILKGASAIARAPPPAASPRRIGAPHTRACRGRARARSARHTHSRAHAPRLTRPPPLLLLHLRARAAASIAARKRGQKAGDDFPGRSSPVLERLEAGEGASAFVGPLGGFRDLKYSRSAKDLLKSRSVDETSQMLCRSQSQREFERFAYDSSFAQTDPTAHYAPSDRIGRNFTPTAKSLTMKKAQGISKAIMFGGGKPVLSRKPRGAAATPVVTAPAAYNTMAFGADDVLKHAPGPSEDAAWPKLLPSLDSPNTKRMRLRQERSVDDSRYLAPTPKLM